MPSPTNAVEAVRALARIARILDREAGELSLAHYRVLSAIATGDARASRVATRLALGRPAVTAAVDVLARRGLVIRQVYSDDQRVAALSITESGRAVLDAAEASMAARLLELCRRTDEPAAALTAIAALGPALEELAEDRLREREDAQ